MVFQSYDYIYEYANMQATGMVNDHVLSCFRHQEVNASVK